MTHRSAGGRRSSERPVQSPRGGESARVRRLEGAPLALARSWRMLDSAEYKEETENQVPLLPSRSTRGPRILRRDEGRWSCPV